MAAHFRLLSTTAIALLSLTAIAHAQQTPFTFTVCNVPDADDHCQGTGTSYVGVAFDSALEGTSSIAGGLQEAGNSDVGDAYDGWGALYGTSDPATYDNAPYATPFNGLSGSRQTETDPTVTGMPDGSVRWFDSFTNETDSTITANIAFGGNLGSDSITYIHATGDGYVVTGQGAPGGQSYDPVILHLYGNNAYALTSVGVNVTNEDDNPFFVFPVSVAPGQTVAIMNVNVLYGSVGRGSDPDGSIYAADVLAAEAYGQLFVNSPIFDGLTADQVATLINWNVSVDGSLPTAGASATLAFAAQDALGGMLSRNAFVSLRAAAPDATGRVSVSSSGGKVALASNGQTSAFLLKGLLGGNESFAEGVFDYDGYLLGAGIEHGFDNGLTAGVAVAKVDSDGTMSGVYPKVSASEFVFSPYFTWTAPADIEVFGRLFVSDGDFRYSRIAGAGTAFADYSGLTYGGTVEASKSFGQDGAGWSAFAGLSFARASMEGYEETGAGTANLTVPDYDVDRTDLYAGVRHVTKWTTANGSGLLGFVGAGLGTELSGNGSVVTTYTGSATPYLSTLDNGRDTYGLIEVGLSGQVSKNVSVDASYGARLGSDTENQSASLKIKMQF